MTSIINKQPDISELFTKLIENNRLQHAYIFEGVSGTGKFEMAKWVAQNIFCANKIDGKPCLECNLCQRIAHEEHPDVIIVEPDGLSIKVDQVRQIREEFSKSGVESRKKVLIVQEMDKMTTSAANSLLKFIEEPAGEVTIMLLTTEIQQMLPTIVSRSQVIHFPVRDIETRIEDLLEKKIPEKHATILAYLTQDTDEAAELADSKIFGQIVNLVWQWFLLLAENGSRAFIFVETDIKPLMKEADSKRDTTSLIIDLLILVYRDLMSLCFNQERVLAFSDHSVRLKEIADASMRKNIADNLTILLNAKKKLNSNVAAQGVLEQIAIKMMNQSS